MGPAYTSMLNNSAGGGIAEYKKADGVYPIALQQLTLGIQSNDYLSLDRECTNGGCSTMEGVVDSMTQ